MSSPLSLLFLGTGTSTGVPVIGCSCPVCRSGDSRNARLRSSVLLRTERTTLLVDSCPDLRQQALRYGLTAVDAVVYTHAHLDHVTGFDDLRAFCWKHDVSWRLPFYAGLETMESLERMFPWAFNESRAFKGYIRPEPHVHGGLPFCVGDVAAVPFRVEHADAETFGYVFEHGGVRIGYACDVKSIPPDSKEMLHDLDVLVLDGLRFAEHPTHSSVGESLELMRELEPKLGVLTHMGHDVDYAETSARLPGGVVLAYDGMMLDVE